VPTVVDRAETNSFWSWSPSIWIREMSLHFPWKNFPWWQTGVLVALVAWLYSSVIVRLVSQWRHDEDFSHGFIVPLFSLYVTWRNRERLAQLPSKPSWWGGAIIFVAMAMLVVGTMGAELFLSRTSLLVLTAGLIVQFFGWQHFRALLFPWAFLILMIPIPKIILNEVTLPLQSLAAKVAAHVLPWFEVPVLREGNVIYLPTMPLEVAEACSGIRSLLSLITLSIIYAFFRESQRWLQVALVLVSIPIAIVANSARIVGTGLVVQYWDPEKAEGFYHAFSSWMLFLFAVLLLMLFHQLLLRRMPWRQR
jgi:exosortase